MGSLAKFINSWSGAWGVSLFIGIIFFIIEYRNPMDYGLFLAIGFSLVGILQLAVKLINSNKVSEIFET